MAVTTPLTFRFYQYVELVEFYPVIHSLWRSDTAVRTYI